MFYQSTRGIGTKLTSAQAIAQGLSTDGGLFVPESFPKVTMDYISSLVGMPYSYIAKNIMGLYLSDFSEEELEEFTKKAYKVPGFDCEDIAPVHKLCDGTHFLELWHGPTAAFKDMALQMLPHLLVASLKKTNEDRKVCILVATSGDTGKAALEGFKDIDGTCIVVFYPVEGVSDVQKLQMNTQEGNNLEVIAVEGNFDDAQTGVKNIFSDVAFREQLDKEGYFLSSANSINWGRLVPQIVYYFSAYCSLIKSGDIKLGDEINFCVPTGNFGNILAGYYAKQMGLPVGKLICASNSNDVLTQFIDTGVYDKNRQFFTTMSPSMDILVSSNLERLLYEVGGKNGEFVNGLMTCLNEKGIYEVSSDTLAKIKDVFSSGTCDEAETKRTILEVFNEFNYLMDTHTAVAHKVLNDYRIKSGDNTPAVIVSTASAFKFCENVLGALEETAEISEGGVELLDKLSTKSNCQIPAPLGSLKGKKERFSTVVATYNMKEEVSKFLRG